MKNILIKSKPLLNLLVSAFIISMLINPLAKFTWNFLISASNRFSIFLTNQIIGYVARGSNIPIEAYIFLIVCLTFIFMSSRRLWTKVKIKNNSVKLQIITVVILFVLFNSVAITHIIISELNTIFKQRMGIIAPYINDEKEEEIWSKWYLMESKIDYTNLNHELENIAENNNIKFIKSF